MTCPKKNEHQAWKLVFFWFIYPSFSIASGREETERIFEISGTKRTFSFIKSFPSSSVIIHKITF